MAGSEDPEGTGGGGKSHPWVLVWAPERPPHWGSGVDAISSTTQAPHHRRELQPALWIQKGQHHQVMYRGIAQQRKHWRGDVARRCLRPCSDIAGDVTQAFGDVAGDATNRETSMGVVSCCVRTILATSPKPLAMSPGDILGSAQTSPHVPTSLATSPRPSATLPAMSPGTPRGHR